MGTGTGGKGKKEYSSRVKRLRRLIIMAVVLSCLIPTTICLILAVRVDRLRTDIEQTSADLEWYRNRYGSEMEILYAAADASDVQTGQIESKIMPDYSALEYSGEFSETDESQEEEYDTDYAVVDMSGAQNPEDIEGTRYVYLTFDDGPSSSTGEILDILAQYDVKATFFVCGKPNAEYKALYKRIADEGHTLGMHSYSHKYSVLYASLDSFRADMYKLRSFLYDTTGQWAQFYRFPGGSSNSVSKVEMEELAEYLEGEGVQFFDWNVSAGDDRAGANKDTIYANIVNNVPRFKHCVVLMHDSADKKSTVEALPEIIEAIQSMDDTVIVPITEDTLPVQHIKY